MAKLAARRLVECFVDYNILCGDSMSSGPLAIGHIVKKYPDIRLEALNRGLGPVLMAEMCEALSRKDSGNIMSFLSQDECIKSSINKMRPVSRALFTAAYLGRRYQLADVDLLDQGFGRAPGASQPAPTDGIPAHLASVEEKQKSRVYSVQNSKFRSKIQFFHI